MLHGWRSSAFLSRVGVGSAFLLWWLVWVVCVGGGRLYMLCEYVTDNLRMLQR